MIQFHEESKTFHLYNDQISYIFKILKNNQLGQLYYGKRIHDRETLIIFLKQVLAQCHLVAMKVISLFH